MVRITSLAAAVVFAALPPASQAQTSIAGTPQQVQVLAPQLVTFAGSQANFDALVTGLTQGGPVTLTTVDASGNVQIVTFSSPGNLAPAEAARVLENARSSLIANGIAAPNAQQIAVALVGGSLPTPAGTANVNPALPGLSGTQLVQVRNEFAGAANPATLNAGTLTGPNAIAAVRNNLAQRGFSAFEVNQALQLANVILAQNGIVAPTADQLQTALSGGNLLLPSGQSVPVAGVLAGQAPATGALIATPAAPSPASNAAAAAGSSGGRAAIRR